MPVVCWCSSDGRADRGGRGGRGGRVGPRQGQQMTRYYSGDSADVSRLLDSLLRGYDQRLRPNYNGQLDHRTLLVTVILNSSNTD